MKKIQKMINIKNIKYISIAVWMMIYGSVQLMKVFDKKIPIFLTVLLAVSMIFAFIMVLLDYIKKKKVKK